MNLNGWATCQSGRAWAHPGPPIDPPLIVTVCNVKPVEDPNMEVKLILVNFQKTYFDRFFMCHKIMSANNNI